MGETRFDAWVLNRLQTPGILTGIIANGDRPANPGSDGWIFIDWVTQEIYTYEFDGGGWILIGSGTGGGGAVSGSGITVTAGVVDLGRPGTPLSVDGDLNTTGGFYFKINGGILDFDNTFPNRLTIVNGDGSQGGIEGTFCGLGAGESNTGNAVSAFGYRALANNVDDNATGFGRAAGDQSVGSNFTAVGAYAGQDNTGNSVTFFGAFAGNANSGNGVIAIGDTAGSGNAINNVFLFGNSATATGEGQVSFHPSNFSGILDFNNLSADQTWEMSGLQLENGTFQFGIGDFAGLSNGNFIIVDDPGDQFIISNGLTSTPLGIAPTSKFINVNVFGIDNYYIPLWK